MKTENQRVVRDCRRTIYLLVILLLLPVKRNQAEVLHLKDGRELSGTIVEQTPESITLVNADGTRQRILKSAIKKILFGAAGELKVERLPLDGPDRLDLSPGRETAKRGAAASEESLWDRMHQDYAVREEAKSEESGSDPIVVIPGEERERKGIVLRSALFPGWGQMSNGKTYRGLLYSTLFIGGLAYGNSQMSQWRGAANRFDSGNQLTTLAYLGKTGMPALALFSYENAQQDRQAMEERNMNLVHASIAVGILYLWNLFDAALLSKKDHSPGWSTVSLKTGWEIAVMPSMTNASSAIRASHREMATVCFYTLHF